MKIITGRHADDLIGAKKSTSSLNHFFPEVSDGGFGIHPTDLLEKCATLTGDQIVTVSEHVILYFCNQVQLGKMKASDLEIIYIPEQNGEMTKHAISIQVDDKGDFVTPWPDMLFEESFYLRFPSPEKDKQDVVRTERKGDDIQRPSE